MLPFILILIVLYAVVNALGAWAVVRRKRWLAGPFMLAASLLVVAAVAITYGLPFARVLLATGLVLASVSSYLYGRVVLGRVTWSHQLTRAAVAVALYLAASAALA